MDWCDTCQTVLATIQVEDGTCWRCHNPVRLIQRPQWYLRISEYVQENDRRLAELAASGIWDENALASQRFVLGRVDGVELDLSPARDGEPLTVFTPHAEALDLARFVASRRSTRRSSGGPRDEVAERLEELRAVGLERSAREAQTMPFVDTGRLLSPTGGDPLPVIVTPMVDGRFGATAVFGVPERDRTDALIAERLFGTPANPAMASPGDAPAEDTRRIGPRAMPSRRAHARPFATAPTTSPSPDSALGARRSRSSIAMAAGRCRCPRRRCR